MIPSDAIEFESRFQLRVRTGVDAGKTMPLRQTRVIVGRSSDADFEIRELFSPRQRFAIVWLAETNRYVLDVWPHPTPVLLNSHRCTDRQTYELAEGDLISLGNTVLVFERMTAGERKGDKSD